MLPEVLLIRKLIYVIQEVNIMKYTRVRAWLWLVATGVGEEWGLEKGLWFLLDLYL